MLASSAVEMQFGVEGHSPSEGVPYMSCTPARRQQIVPSSNSVKTAVRFLKCPADDELQEVFMLSQTAKAHAMCTACVPSFCGLGAAPNVNRAPRTPTFTLCNTSSLYSGKRSREATHMPYLLLLACALAPTTFCMNRHDAQATRLVLTI